MKEGEYLLAVDGQEIEATKSLFAYFTGKAGQVVKLKIGPKPDGTDARQITVVPTEGENTLRLANWAERNRQMVDILNAVLTDGLPAVEAACAEALGHGVHSADVVLNILARQREPAPPANIMTPAALTLRHAPIADCARYDNLRRTI